MVLKHDIHSRHQVAVNTLRALTRNKDHSLAGNIL